MTPWRRRDAAPSQAITGVYSHRFDDAWLVGGASNAGCRVLRHFDFTEAELADLSPGLDADATNGAGIYPLVNEGERFPVNDAAKQPRLPARNDLYFCRVDIPWRRVAAPPRLATWIFRERRVAVGRHVDIP